MPKHEYNRTDDRVEEILTFDTRGDFARGQRKFPRRGRLIHLGTFARGMRKLGDHKTMR